MKSSFQLSERGLLVACSHCGSRNRMPYEQLAREFRCGNCHAQLASPAEPLEVQNEAAFAALVGGSTLPLLVDFWAEWCGPCKMVAPEVAKVAADGQGQWVVAKVNTELLPGLAQQFRISGIPTFVLFQSGSEIGRTSGAMPASALREFIRQQPFAGPKP
jgi:thioredoxin 2